MTIGRGLVRICRREGVYEALRIRGDSLRPFGRGGMSRSRTVAEKPRAH